jgi:phenylalanyl-tRNA synthetase beta chain
MKISLNWLNELITLPDDPTLIEHTLTSLGLEVEGVEHFESVKGGLKGVVVGKVVECDTHPNADRLSLTKVELGDGEPVQIVCGAPNVAKGQTVFVATVGTTLYDKNGEGWEIKKAKIRGERSFGMICAEDELGLGTSHEGIMVLDDKWEAGTPAADVVEIVEDTIFDIGLTPNRSDATHHSGVAKDLNAAFRIRHQKDLNYRTPLLKRLEINGPAPIEVEVSEPKACPRYSGILIENITVGQSPEWLRIKLEAIGVRSINNVVDVTNLVLHELGQPLHAFDMDKVAGRRIRVGFLPDGTSFLSLDEVERKLSAEDLMICDGEGKPMCMGGIFGGIDSGVTDETTSIFLESAHFDAKYIRRSSTRHLLRTEAAKIFEKGSDPSITIQALERAAYLLEQVSGATVKGGIIDLYPVEIEPEEITLQTEFVNRLSGGSFTTDDLENICLALDMEMTTRTDDALTVRVPVSKWDVKRPVDIVEEIMRVYGFDQIPLKKQLRTTLIPADYPDIYHVWNLIADHMVSLGFNQMANLSITQSSYYPDRVKDELVFINNTSNSHLNIMRPDLVRPALETAAFNLNRRVRDLKLFEIGKRYIFHSGEFIEKGALLIMASGNIEKENWKGSGDQVDYSYMKGIVNSALVRCGAANIEFRKSQSDARSSFVEIARDSEIIGEIFVPGQELLEMFDIDQEIWMAQIELQFIIDSMRSSRPEYQEISRFPSVRRDLALLISKDLTYGEIERVIVDAGGSKLKEINLFDVYDNEDQLGKGRKSYAISLLFEDNEKTLTDKEIEKNVDRILKKLVASFDLELR